MVDILGCCHLWGFPQVLLGGGWGLGQGGRQVLCVLVADRRCLAGRRTEAAP